MKKRKCYIYTRVSTAIQVDGYSLDAQKDKLRKYAEFQDKILLSEDYPAVNILYKAQATDEDGLPFITEKEMEAIAAYCAYAYDLKRGRVQKDQATLQLAQMEYAMWSKLCSEARVADSLSQNEINEILDVLTSFDIHSYNVSSTKPIK